MTKSLITLVLSASLALAQQTPLSTAARTDGSNINQSAFLTALGGSTAGKALFQISGNGTNGQVPTSNGSGGVTWSTITSNLTSGPVTSSGGVSAIADGALSIAKTSGLQEALDTKRTMDLADFNVVLEGDSIFAGSTAGGATSGNFLQDRLAVKSFFSGRATFFNVATAGEGIASVISQYASQVYPRRPSANSGKRAVLILLVGTNDSTTDATIATNVTSLLSYISTAKSDGFEVWVCTLLPRGASGSVNQWDGFNRRLKSSSIPDKIIDLNAIFRDSTDTALFGDNLHPTNAGYELMAQEINRSSWSDQAAATPTFGSLAKQNSDALTFTGGGGTLNLPVTIDSTNSHALVVTGANAVNIDLNPNGSTETYLYADAAAGFYGITHYDGSGFRDALKFTAGSGMALALGGDVTANTAGKTFRVKAGTNAKAGTFTLVAGTATVSNTSITANSVVIPTLKTVGGTRAGLPDIVPTSGVGFVATGGGSDTSTYNYIIIEVVP